MDEFTRLRDVTLEGLPLPLEDPAGDAHLEILEGIELSSDPSVARMQRRIAAAAEKCLAMEATKPESEQITFACADCLGQGWIYVPCGGRSSDGKRRCNECSWRHDHQVLRACMSCDLGIVHEAGIWFRRICRHDRRGKPVVDESKLPAFDRAMLRHGPNGAKVKAELDRMIAGESERGAEHPA